MALYICITRIKVKNLDQVLVSGFNLINYCRIYKVIQYFPLIPNLIKSAKTCLRGPKCFLIFCTEVTKLIMQLSKEQNTWNMQIQESYQCQGDVMWW